jgi:hypothetical protein
MGRGPALVVSGMATSMDMLPARNDEDPAEARPPVGSLVRRTSPTDNLEAMLAVGVRPDHVVVHEVVGNRSQSATPQMSPIRVARNRPLTPG